jgi:hypothetical protein
MQIPCLVKTSSEVSITLFQAEPALYSINLYETGFVIHTVSQHHSIRL